MTMHRHDFCPSYRIFEEVTGLPTEKWPRIKTTAPNLRRRASTALVEDRHLWPVLFVIPRSRLIAPAQHLGNRCIELW